MKDALIFKGNEIEKQNLMDIPNADAGWMKMIPAGYGKGTMMFGVSEIAPGYAGHRWHDHVLDKGQGFEVHYPEGFEEIYYILSGKGIVQWKDDNNIIHEKAVEAGDTIVFPEGIGKHQLYNNGTEKIVIVFAGNKLPEVILK